MNLDKNSPLLRNLINGLQVNVEIAGLTKCWREWRDIDYIPNYNKFYFICDGQGWLKINGKEFYPLPSQLVLMPAGVTQSYSSINDNTFTKYWCHFSAKIGDINIFDVLQLPYFVDIKDKSHFKLLFKELINNYKSQSLSASFRTKAILLEIIAQFIDNAKTDNIQLYKSEFLGILHIFTEYVEKHLSEDITIKQIARAVNFHPNYFIRYFKAHTGSSPMHYIIRIRMERAKELIVRSEMTVSEIGIAIGFNDLSYFSKAFKNYTGYSPSEFRKINPLADKKRHL